MHKNQVKIGGVYRAKIGKAVTDVQIKSTGFPRGWVAVNLKTGREVRIRTAAKLRNEVQAAEPKVVSPAPFVDFKSRAAGERDE